MCDIFLWKKRGLLKVQYNWNFLSSEFLSYNSVYSVFRFYLILFELGKGNWSLDN